LERLGYGRVIANGASTSALAPLLRPLSRELTMDLALALINVQANAETQISGYLFGGGLTWKNQVATKRHRKHKIRKDWRWQWFSPG